MFFKPAMATSTDRPISSGVTWNSGTPALISKYSPPSSAKGPWPTSPFHSPLPFLFIFVTLSLVPFSPLPLSLSSVSGVELNQLTYTFDVAAHLAGGPTGPPGKRQAARCGPWEGRTGPLSLWLAKPSLAATWWLGLYVRSASSPLSPQFSTAEC